MVGMEAVMVGVESAEALMEGGADLDFEAEEEVTAAGVAEAAA